jgi:hypothetical protein
MKFSASLDKLTIIITTFVLVTVVCISVWVFYFLPGKSLYGQISLYAGAAVLLVSFLLYPTSYFADENFLKVNSVLFSRSICKTDITEVVQPTNEKMKNTVRIVGSGGFFGYFGLFYNATYKWMIWFATQRKNYVLVKTTKRKFIFTPDQPEEFVKALQRS